jgi:pimeloyl-ACP methyl ester carboxylesterase
MASRSPARTELMVDAAPGYRLWAEATGDRDAPPLLLIMGANASGLAWPDALVDRLAEQHYVVRYDHRDTGRSTRAFAERPYPITALAADALTVLDAFGARRAHVAGMSLGGLLVQLLLLDAPERLRSATVFCTGPLPGGAGTEPPGPRDEVLALWEHLGEPRDREAEVAFNVEHWRVLSGAAAGGPFDEDEFRQLEERIRDHAGHDEPTAAHALADPSNLERGAELAHVRTPVLVVEAPLDPVFPPPNAGRLVVRIGSAHLVSVPRMAHALPAAVLPELAEAILAHTAAADARTRTRG